MGKKKDKRLDIDEEPDSRKQKKIEKINEYCLVLSVKQRKKIIANFEPATPLQQNEVKTYIEFNTDGQKCSPAFIYEKKLRPLARYQEAYANRLKAAREAEYQPIKPVQPRERKNKESYCAVCKTSYLKYFEHIKNKEHITNCQENQFAKFLKKIEKFYIGKKERRASKPKGANESSAKRIEV